MAGLADPPKKGSGNRQRTSSSHLFTLYQLQARPVPASNHQSHRSWDFMRLRYRNMRLNLGCNASMEQSFNLYPPLYCGPRESWQKSWFQWCHMYSYVDLFGKILNTPWWEVFKENAVARTACGLEEPPCTSTDPSHQCPKISGSWTTWLWSSNMFANMFVNMSKHLPKLSSQLKPKK